MGEPGGFDITPLADRVQLVDAEHAGVWESPAIGAVTAPTAVVIRPDGHVARVGDGTDLGLPDALTSWYGMPVTGGGPARRPSSAEGRCPSTSSARYGTRSAPSGGPASPLGGGSHG